MIALYLLLASPPVVLSASPAPAPRSVGIRSTTDQQPAEAAVPMTVDIAASVGGRTIWQGSLRLKPGASGSYSSSLEQAEPAACPARDSRDRRGERSAFRINVSLSNGREGYARFDLNWSRPTGDCLPSLLEASVSLSGEIHMDAGKPVTVEGDGGLRVRFTRRP
jgi:hypothetical protein